MWESKSISAPLSADRAETLLREALTLSPEQRADVAADLLASLDDSDAEDPAAVQAAWAAEIERLSPN